MLVLPFLSLERIVNIIIRTIWKSFEDKKSESEKGWYHHLKVEYVRLCFEVRKYYRIRKTHWIKISIPVLGRN